MSSDKEVIRTRIWEETPEQDNPFSASACYCSGYDVYGEILGNASWFEYLYLLFKQQRPTPEQVSLLETLAVALANPGPRDHSVRAAMNAGVGGSTHAASLIAALAIGAGQNGGAHEVAICMEYWQKCGQDLDEWKNILLNQPEINIDIWCPMEHPPGFDPHGSSCSQPVRQTLTKLAQLSTGVALPWLETNRIELEAVSKTPLAFTGVAAAALIDVGFDPKQGEMLFLLLRLPGAAAHALEQEELGWRNYPFFGDGLTLENDPGPKTIRQDEKTAGAK